MTMSQLDATQVLKSAFDSVTGALKTNVVQSVSNVVDLDSISSVFIDEQMWKVAVDLFLR